MANAPSIPTASAATGASLDHGVHRHDRTATMVPTFARQGPAAGGDPDTLLRTEWLLTNGQGGFSMGTAIGAMSRRYHGLLIAPLRPPVERVMALNAGAETLVLDPGSQFEQRFDLSTFMFRPGVLHPRGDSQLVRFEKDVNVRWHYQVGPARVTKTVHLFRDQPAVAIRYSISTGGKPARLTIRPLVSLRDFHSLILRDTARERFHVELAPHGCKVSGPQAALSLALSAPNSPGGKGEFTRDEQWWFDFQYDMERDRQYDFLEDLFHPGVFTAEIPAGRDQSIITLHAGMLTHVARDPEADADHTRGRLDALIEATRKTLGTGAKPSPALPALVVASDAYVVRRVAPGNGPLAGAPDSTTIIAGYPWFADWGRDSMISLPGLLLSTGRYHEAREVLRTFAKHRKDGLIPNVFDDYTGEAHYNTVDASLWFVHACCQYREITGDAITFKDELLPACLDVVEHYRRGTHYGISMDAADALISAGDASTQLTWMDAKRNGVAFTPRHGKPVEINALWFNALASLVQSGVGLPNAADLAALRDRAGESFRKLFWNPRLNSLADSLQPTHESPWTPQYEVRPNQIFAVSLPNSPLTQEQKQGVVDYVRTRLLTPLAVRTLDPADSRYRGRYRGAMFQRDSAYHNGTAWPWLLGPLAEAVLRVGNFSPAARDEARRILAPSLAFLDADCPGHLPEVFDGDDSATDPQRSGGCPAQAWSIAETLRVLVLIDRV